jgi:hypothetical protein
VRERGVRAGETGDIEGEPVRAAGPDPPLEVEGEVLLGDARPDRWQQRRQRAIRDRTRRGDALQL